MSQLTGSYHPSGSAHENKESASIAEKSAMSSPGNRNAITTQRNKTPTTQSGRSSTHGDSTSNSTEDGNRSQINSARRAPTKPSVNLASHKRPSSALPAGSMLRPENQYSIKKKRYLQLKKELMDKQKHAQDLYNDMSQLRDKLIAAGAKDPGKLEDLKLEIGPPKQFPLTDPANTDQVNSHIEKLAIGTEFLESLESRLEEIPKKSQSLCRELLEKQLAFVAFVTSHLINTSEEATPETDTSNAEITMQLEVHQKDWDNLTIRLNEIEEMEANSIAGLMKNVRDLIGEYENSRMKLREMKVMESQKELEAQLNATMEELQMEREKNNQSKERVRQAEAQLQRSRTKIRELEAHVANDDGKIQQLQANVKSLEAQMKQKDQAMEMKLKDMQRTMKSSEGLVSKMEKQRDSFETRLMELREKMGSKENDAMNRIKEMSEKLNAVTNEVGMEREKRQQVEEAFVELEERYKNLEEKSKQLCDLAEKNKDFTITEGSHTDNEVRLFNELQAAKAELEMQRQMMLQLQQEKEEIVAVMHQAASRDEDEDSKEKLAAELVFKSNELQNLMMQHSELKKVAKNAQERNGVLESQLMEIQNRLHSQSKEGGKAGLSAHAIELQQEVSDLRNNLAEIIRQKKELETALTQKQLELEQRDRVMREQSKFLKVRDELLDILKGKTQQENGELSNSDENEYTDQVQKQIAAKTEAIQELYATLESKQLQIMRLEKMVKLMEDQQDRAQAQRTRLENRIAQLELTLQRNKEQRGKGFGIL